MRVVSDLSDIQPVAHFEDIPERITGRIAVRGDCWIWTGIAAGKGGSPKVKWDRERSSVSVARLVYTLLVGPLPPSMDLVKLCRVTKCVNPDHLNLDPPGEAGGQITALTYSTETYRRALSELLERHGEEFQRLRHDISMRPKHSRKKKQQL